MKFQNTPVMSANKKLKIYEDFDMFFYSGMDPEFFSVNMILYFGLFSGLIIPGSATEQCSNLFGNPNAAKTTFDKIINMSVSSHHPDLTDLNHAISDLFSHYRYLVDGSKPKQT